MTVVAILGRANVGKSTLFNRLSRGQKAIVDKTPGVTRNYQEGHARLGNALEFTLLDTAGFEGASLEHYAATAWGQSKKAATQADLILFVLDGREGVIPLDEELIRQLRPLQKPILLLANKCEGTIDRALLSDAYKFGLGAPILVSSAHGLGMQDLYTALTPHVQHQQKEANEKPGALQLVILGRPNSGKSTLVNSLLKDERVLTGEEAGLTTDSIATNWCYKGHPLCLVDTAGLRRQSHIEKTLENLATKEALNAMKLAHVVVLVLEAMHPLEKQDLILAKRVIEEGRSLVLALNKWDQIPSSKKKLTLKLTNEKLAIGLPQVAGLPIVPISALQRQGLSTLMDEVLRIYALWNRRITTASLNQWLKGALSAHPLPLSQGRRLRLKYMTQIKTRPPTFVLFSSKPGEIPMSYQRYLTNSLRKTFDFPGVPLRLILKSGNNPYVG